MDLNLLSIIICVLNITFLLIILSIFSFPFIKLFFLGVVVWISLQISILIYGIMDNKIGFIVMPLTTLIITLLSIIFQAGDLRRIDEDKQ